MCALVGLCIPDYVLIVQLERAARSIQGPTVRPFPLPPVQGHARFISRIAFKTSFVLIVFCRATCRESLIAESQFSVHSHSLNFNCYNLQLIRMFLLFITVLMVFYSDADVIHIYPNFYCVS